jgi:hypothetical protein
VIQREADPRPLKKGSNIAEGVIPDLNRTFLPNLNYTFRYENIN